MATIIRNFKMCNAETNEVIYESKLSSIEYEQYPFLPYETMVIKHGVIAYECKECGEPYELQTNYCSNCGARMDK